MRLLKVFLIKNIVPYFHFVFNSFTFRFARFFTKAVKERLTLGRGGCKL